MVKWLFTGDPASREQPQTPRASKRGPLGKGWRNQGSAAQGPEGHRLLSEGLKLH